MRDKLTVESLADMMMTARRQAEIANIHPSTFHISKQNPTWPSSIQHMTAVKNELQRILQNLSPYPEHNAWSQATLNYLKTMELFDHDD
jgi:hypothetical protein